MNDSALHLNNISVISFLKPKEMVPTNLMTILTQNDTIFRCTLKTQYL